MTTEDGPDETAAAVTEPAGTEATPAPAPAPEATPAAAGTVPAPERGRRKTRAAAQVLGAVGLVVSAVLAIGILLAHGWASDAVGNIFETADRQIERGSTIVELATARVQERVTDIDTFIADASSITPGANIPPEIAARAAAFADRYDAVRNQFAELRARVESGLDTVRQVARLVPFIDLPEAPSDELAALDARLQRFDDSLAALRQGTISAVVAERVVEGATNLRGAIGEVADLGGRIQTRLDQAQERLVLANSRVDGYLWIVTIVLLLLVAYIAILNGLVIWLARRDRDMRLTAWEEERLLIFTAAELARRHRDRGLLLNAPEAVALICDAMLEAARGGASYAEVETAGRGAVTADQVLPGVAALVGDVRLEVLMDDGVRLVVLLEPLGPSGDDDPGTVRRPAETSPATDERPGDRIIDLEVTSTSARVVRVSSHHPFHRVNARLVFDRDAARGRHLDLPAGSTERWSPGETRTVRLVRYGGAGGDDRGHSR